MKISNQGKINILREQQEQILKLDHPVAMARGMQVITELKDLLRELDEHNITINELIFQLKQERMLEASQKTIRCKRLEFHTSGVLKN